MEKYFSLPIKFELLDDNSMEDDDLLKMKIYVMHDGLNYNNSSFTFESMENSKSTLRNKPILAYVEKIDGEDNKDFKGHEVELKIVTGENGLELKETYLERPIGIIPETNNYRYEEIDGDNYVVVDGYIWKTYANDALDIILKDGEKKVSMEIKVLEGETNSTTGVYEINKYQYLGVTMLGENHPPAMGDNCRAEIYSIKQNFETQYYQKIEDLNNKLKESLSKEKIDVDKDLNNKNNFNKLESEVKENMADVEKIVDNPTEPIIPVEDKQDFSLSVQQIYTAVDKALATKIVIGEDWWGDPVEMQEFYSIDLIPDDKMVVVIDNATWSNYFGLPYNMNGDVAELDFDNMKPYMRGEWREVQDGSPVIVQENFSKIKEAFEQRLKTFSDKAIEKTKAEFNVKETEEYKTLETELNTTKEQFNKAVESADEVLKTENQTLKEDFAKLQDSLNTVKTELQTEKDNYAKLNEDFSKVKEDNQGLLEFKADIEKQDRVNKVDEKLAEFSFEEEEIKDIREKAYNNELSFEAFEEKLYVLEGIKAHKTKNNFSKQEVKETTGYKINNSVSDSGQPYGSISMYFEKEV